MTAKFERIDGHDEIFSSPEYIKDSVVFNAIESARFDDNYVLYSDHKSAVITTSKSSNRVWIWTSEAISDDTSKLVDISRFVRDCRIPKVELYVKQEISDNLSDIYSLASTDINYSVKEELSLAVFMYQGEKQSDSSSADGQIIRIDKGNADHVRMVTDFFRACCDEFRWHDKFDRKVEEYLNAELYALVKDGRMIANSVIGSHTEKYIRIKSIAVLQEERQKGYGTAMCRFAVNRILDDDHIPMLYAHIGNVPAMALWNKAGFRMYDKIYLIKIAN